MRNSGLRKTLRAIAAVALLAGLVACATPVTDAPDDIAQPGGNGDRELRALVRNADLETAIPGQFIVVFENNPAFDGDADANRVPVIQRYPNALRIVEAFDIEILHSFSTGLIAIGIQLPDDAGAAQAALRALLELQEVAYIEANQRGEFYQTVIQPAPTWGLDRVDERLLPLDNQYAYDGDATNVHAYIIDSGMRVTHNEFGGRATQDFTVHTSGDMSDCFNHGTHVGGTVGGTTFGIAKDVTLHSVRVGNDSCIPDTMSVIAGVQWVTANLVLPAVANMSLGVPQSAALDTAVNNSIAAGVTYVVAAGNANADACLISPARIPNVITVGAIDITDTRAGFSNFGTCIDIFAPGVNITSATNANDTGSFANNGTSMASPHVAGVAARYLGDFSAATPADVWNRIAVIANVSPGTAGWPGITNPGAGSPNRLLVWLALDSASDDGDPHLTTVNGTRYDFHAAGEFVALLDRNGTEIQTRQTPVASAGPIANAHTGLNSCVSVNSAVSARIGARRLSFQPEHHGDGGDMVLRIDGVPVAFDAMPINLGGGGRVSSSPVGAGIEVVFPDGTRMVAIPWFWPSHSQWMLQISVFETPAKEGLLGFVGAGEWLPALPNGSTLGPRPASVSQRFSELNQTFADAWRVTSETSLFDYAQGESTGTFTNRGWPPNSSRCDLPARPPVNPATAETAQRVCRMVRDDGDRQNCISDVQATGEAGFAEVYLLSDRVKFGGTRVDVTQRRTARGMEYIATVRRLAPNPEAGVVTGSVQFILAGQRIGPSVPLDRMGQAVWMPPESVHCGCDELVAAEFLPADGSGFLPSSSAQGRTITGLPAGRVGDQ